jgi:Uncharacterized protein conserved in bacteria
MKLLRYILVLALLYWAMDATAQTKQAQPANNIYNKLDAQGKRHGIWVLQHGGGMGEDPYTEIGTYDHGVRAGSWYRLDEGGELQAIETYRNDIKDGEAKYFEKGLLIATGNFRGLNPSRDRDTFMVEDPITGLQSLKSVPTERGTVRHGTWRFYDADNGRLTREEEYQVDEVVYHKEFGMTKQDSIYYQKRVEKMPHSKKKNYYKPPTDKQINYGY